MNKLPECERPSVSLLACRRAQHATPQPKRSADCPRSRGVYRRPPCPGGQPAGSSPLARGLRVDLLASEFAGRIIPARAGFTTWLRSPPALGGDHPRSRGVYVLGAWCGGGHVGSSPLARGLPPAQPGWFAGPGDHPRSRGVYSQRRWRGGSTQGSSPLARGLPTRSLGSTSPARIIPARAGFTGTYVEVDMTTPGSSPLARGLHWVRVPGS